jgi:predicted RNA methylase
MVATGYLARHSKYIDYRISRIDKSLSQDEIERTQQLHGIISFLIQESSNTCLVPNIAVPHVHDLSTLIQKWDYTAGDIIGYIYQSLTNITCRKRRGQYFTPDEIAAYLVEKSLSHKISDQITVLDPSCGSGQFLLNAYAFLYNHFLSHSTNSRAAARKAITSIYGIDIDPIAVKIAKYNLMKISKCNLDDIKIFTCDYLIKPQTTCFPETTAENLIPLHFDVIVGNPPWRSRFSNEEKRYYRSSYESIESGLNTVSLFIERSFDLIKSNGIITYLIPEAYLNIKGHMTSRRFVLNHTSIKTIELWGDKFKGVFAPSVSIVLEQHSSESIRKKNIIRIKNNTSTDKGVTLLIPQASYYSLPENIFNINHSRKAANILTTIENNDCIFLKNRVKFFLGIVTGNNSKYISCTKTDEHSDPIIVGRDVQQYKISFSNHYFKFDPQELQQVAPQRLYHQKNKILYKFIGRQLTFALDTAGYYSLNNVNGFIPEGSENSILTTLSILNSKVLQYYYQNYFFTVKVLRGNIERLPIKRMNKQSQRKIDALVSCLVFNEIENINDRQTIEDVIFHEYGIRDSIAHAIYEKVC